MKKECKFLIFLFVISLTSCFPGPDDYSSTTDSNEPITDSSEPTTTSYTDSTTDEIVLEDVVLEVNKTIKIEVPDLEEFSYYLTSDNVSVRVDDDVYLTGLKGNQTANIEVVQNGKIYNAFKATVKSSTYVSKHKNAEENEGWFEEIDAKTIQSMRDEFAHGMDISSIKKIYNNGGKFFDKDGNEASLFLILKEAGLNWVRLRLWNDPRDTYIENEIEKTFEYGGGTCDLDYLIWMSKEAKSVGLKVYLDFHYSDFWADPGKQVIPKMWADIKTSDEMASAIYSYTKFVLETLKDENILPDMVALGNEIIGGMLLHSPGGITTSPKGDAPNYITNAKSADSAIRGSASGDFSTLKKYLSSAIDAVNDVDSKILKMIHIAKSVSTAGKSAIEYFYNSLGNLDYDVIGLSCYPFWHVASMSDLEKTFKSLSTTFSNKQICVAETSYGFTYEADSWAKNIFSLTGNAGPKFDYDVSIHGQAQLIHDITKIISSLSNGFGVFYWEGAWIPIKDSGWADSHTFVSWANQGLFSYNGKALGSLEVYNKMKGVIESN